MLKAVMQLPYVSEVVLIPNYQSPLKSTPPFFSDEERLSMLKNVASVYSTSEKKVTVSDMECREKSASYTVDTVTYFSKTHPASSLFFLMGEDSFFQFHRWRDYNKIITLSDLIVVNRSGNEFPQHVEAYIASYPVLRDKVYSLRLTPHAASSTEVRSQLKSGLTSSALEIPECVRDMVLSYLRKKKG